MREPVDIENYLNEEFDFNQRKLDELFKSIEYRRGYAEGLERARETLDELCEYYASVLKAKDQKIMGLQFQLANLDEDYRKEVEEWMNAPMGPINEEEDEDYTIERGRFVDEDGALIDTDDMDSDPEYFVEDLADQEGE